MSLTTYAELQDAIGNTLNRSGEFGSSGTAVARTKEWIAMAEDRIGLDKDIRIRAMETSTDLTVAAQEVALPTGFVAARRIYLDGNPVRILDYLSPHNFWAKWPSSTVNRPKAFTIEGDNLVFGPIPSTSETGKLLYYQRFPALSDSNTTNWLLTNARGVLLYGALIESAVFIGEDPRMQTWAALYDEWKELLQQGDRRDRHSGAPLIAAPDFGPRDSHGSRPL